MKFSTLATCLSSALSIAHVHGFSPSSKSILQNRSIHASKSLLKNSSTSMAEKVLLNPQWPADWPYTEKDLARMDETVDTVFYESPRL